MGAGSLILRGFSIQEFEDRFERIQLAMRSRGMDAMLLTTEDNFHYFTGLDSQFWKSPTRPLYLILPAQGDSPVAVVPSIMLEAMRKTWVSEVYSWPAPRPHDDGVSLLLAHLQGYKTLGMPMNIETQLRMPLMHLVDLVKALPLSLVDATELVMGLRLVKSPAELQKIERACHIASKCHAGLPDRLSALNLENVTEREAINQMKLSLLENGADHVDFIVGKSGRGGYSSIIDGPGRYRSLARQRADHRHGHRVRSLPLRL